MKICHVTSVHPRHDIRICEKECVSLVKAGYDTYLVVNDEESDEEYKGIHILSTGVVDSGRVQRILRAPERVLKKALDVNADIYHLHDPELLRISDKLIKIGKKVIYDAHEDTEKQIETKYWIPAFLRQIVRKIYSSYSRKKLGRMTGIVSVTPSIVDKLSRYNSNTVMITNYPIVEGRYAEKGKHKHKEDKYVFFAGGISEQWCHEKVVEAVEKVEGVQYLFAGREYGGYVTRVNLVGTKAKYLGVLSHDEVMQYYQDAIAGIAILKSNTQIGKDGTLGNTKLFEIMESGRPVVCSDLKLWREIIEKHKCGVCVDCDDVLSISNAIRFLAENQDKGNEMGENGRKAVMDEYNWSTQEKVLYSFYESICKSL